MTRRQSIIVCALVCLALFGIFAVMNHAPEAMQ